MKNTINYRIINLTMLIVLVLILYKFTDLFDVIINVLVALFPFFLGFFISWLLLPISNILKEKIKLKEKTANALSITLSIVILIAILWLIIPQLVGQLYALTNSFPQIVDDLKDNMLPLVDKALQGIDKTWFKDVEWLKYIQGSLGTVKDILLYFVDVFINFFNLIIQIILGYVISFYFMGDIKKFVRSIVSLLPKRHNEKTKKIIVDVSRSLFAYVRGVMITSTIVTIFMTFSLFLLGFEQPLLFGIISGLTNIIPFLGPILGGIPVFLIALSMSYKHAIVVIIVIGIIQFLDANFLQPKIMAKTTNLHPVSIIMGLLIFGTVFGITGMIIATPVLASINTILKHTTLNKKIKL